MQEKMEFINKYHIQSDAKSKINLGLYYNSELVAVMTFGHSRFNHNCKYELVRYCTKSGVNVIGGAARLFKYFVTTVMNENEACISYSDIAKTRGNIYKILGFEYASIDYPNYIWTNGHNAVSRYKCRMKNEINVMHESGYYRIFDSGVKTWIYTKKNIK